MASSYTNLGIEKISSGDQSGAWGNTTNDNMAFIDAAISQKEDVTMVANVATITVSDGVTAANDGRKAYIEVGGVLTANGTLTVAPNDLEKIYYIKNSTTSATTLFGVEVTQGTGDSVLISPGGVAVVYCDGGGVSATVSQVGSFSSSASNSLYATAGEMFHLAAQSPGGDAQAYNPNITAAGTGLRSVLTWDFQATDSEFVFFEKKMPDDWNGGSLTFMPVWSPAAATSGDVVWKMQAISYEDGLDWDAGVWSSDFAITTTTATAAKTIHRGAQSASPDGLFTAGTPASAGDVVLFSLHRNASATADTMTGDAMLHGVYIFFNQSICAC